MIEEVVNSCIHDFDLTNCYNSLNIAQRKGKNCFENEQRFDDPKEWHLAGIISLIHCIIPILFALLIFIILCVQSDTNKYKIVAVTKKDSKKFSVSKIRDWVISKIPFPLPIISKVYKSLIEWDLLHVSHVEDGNEREKIEKEEKLQKMLEENEQLITLSMAIEASMEACFQFWFQTNFVLPSVILGITDIGGPNQITDLVNFRLLSILLSFFTFAWSSFTIRNGEKRNAMNYKNFILLVVKIMMDSISRILLFSAWMYTSNNGQFSNWKTWIAFYTIFMVLVAFNINFSSTREFLSMRYWIGGILEA